jgi:lipoprotein NlpD
MAKYQTTVSRLKALAGARSRATGAGVALLSLLLLGCSTTPAPVVEQGRTVEQSAPEIISSNRGSSRSRDLSFESDRSRPTITGSSSPSYTRPAADNPRVQVGTATPSSGGESRISRRPIGSSGSISSSTPTRAEPTVSRGSNSSDSSGLRLPRINPAKHIVSAGDTLFSIAYLYDMDFRDLALANGLNPPYTIFVGQELDLASNLAGSLVDSASNAVGSLVNNRSTPRSTISNPGTDSGQPMPINWQWPHPGAVVSNFQQLAEGIDIRGNVGDPVLAAGAGDVVYSGRGVQGAGNLIIIRHSDRLLSAYAHNSAMLVPEGQHVEAGQQIAEVGVNSNGEPMLHFEIRRDGESVDPMQYLPLKQ